MSQTRITDLEDHFICTVVYLPLRSAPSHKAEMISQVLFGERFRVSVSSGNWLKITTEFDSYEGWIDSLHGGYKVFREEADGIIAIREMMCTEENGSSLIIAPGSELFNLSDDFASFSIVDKTYLLQEGSSLLFCPDSSVTDTALQFLNTPYLWGGRTPWGIDCSGFVQIVFKIHGIALPRDASQQATIGHTVNFISDAKPGDVLFFGENESISHTGILLSPGTIIHSSGTVRTDKVDHQGIWSDEQNRYTQKLRIIRRVNQ